jgi:hypothetical protein
MFDFDSTLNAAVNAEFGEPGDYQPVSGGSAYTLNGIFAEPYRQQVEMEDSRVGWTTTSPSLSTQLVNFQAPPAKGDTWLREKTGSKFVVVDSRPDGVGWVFLILMASQ